MDFEKLSFVETIFSYVDNPLKKKKDREEDK